MLCCRQCLGEQCVLAQCVYFSAASKLRAKSIGGAACTAMQMTSIGIRLPVVRAAAYRPAQLELVACLLVSDTASPHGLWWIPPSLTFQGLVLRRIVPGGIARRNAKQVSGCHTKHRAHVSPFYWGLGMIARQPLYIPGVAAPRGPASDSPEA